MKIAVSVQGTGPADPVDPRFGRCSGLVVFDTETGQHVYVDNSGNMSLAQGAGIQTAQLAADNGANVVISGQVGPKAQNALEQAGIAIYQTQAATVREAIDEYLGNAPASAGSNATPANAGQGFGAGQGMGQGMGGGGRGMGGGGRGMGGGGRGMGGGGRGMGGGGRGMGGGGRGMGGGGRGMGGGGRGR
ncbi:NifB/NifX family molybdenum-iron cluster-binding protein [Pseudodesulfovibrio tunisiensis]|uniref:NifB/NifX family molybdenum-iron cluster-binding protein n=1 Tax=Pseudodesulfovibrio tunisiensis TaxID=463192 RepID=UPI001FB55C57|nr:NifB/NifX family molybdenum-iron cluster-binding protein [Pseudodesulfovibrio tunisiensis]